MKSKHHICITQDFLEFLKEESVRLAKREGSWAKVPLWRVCLELQKEIQERRKFSTGYLKQNA